MNCLKKKTIRGGNMKDYRSFIRYNRDEWENDKEWLGKRMSFLWDMRKYYKDIYMNNELNKELQMDFYSMDDTQVLKNARKDNSYSNRDYANWNNWKVESLYKNLKRLEKLKSENKKEFLKKCNCYLYTFITEQKYEEIQEYEYEQGYKNGGYYG